MTCTVTYVYKNCLPYNLIIKFDILMFQLYIYKSN